MFFFNIELHFSLFFTLFLGSSGFDLLGLPEELIRGILQWAQRGPRPSHGEVLKTKCPIPFPDLLRIGNTNSKMNRIVNQPATWIHVADFADHPNITEGGCNVIY